MYFFQLGLKNIIKCLRKKNSITFKSNVKVGKFSKKSSDWPLMSIVIMYQSTEKTVHEERLVYDQSGMVSQLGGILSLFLGFSFFSLISDFLDLIAKKNMANLTCRKRPSSARGDNNQISMEH